MDVWCVGSGKDGLWERWMFVVFTGDINWWSLFAFRVRFGFLKGDLENKLKRSFPGYPFGWGILFPGIAKEKRLNHPANPSLNHGDRNPNQHTTPPPSVSEKRPNHSRHYNLVIKEKCPVVRHKRMKFAFHSYAFTEKKFPIFDAQQGRTPVQKHFSVGKERALQVIPKGSKFFRKRR